MDYSASVIRFLVFALCCVWGSLASAATVPKRESYVCQQQAHATGSSPAAACGVLAYSPTDASCGIQIGLCADGYCAAIQYGHGYCTVTYNWAYSFQNSCPENSSDNGTDCTCNEGLVASDDGKSCASTGGQNDPPGCKFGTSGTRNFTTGWSRKSGKASAAGDSDLKADEAAVMQAAAFSNTDVCDGKCSMSVGSPSKAWHSNTPASNGMYRMSADFNVNFHGACSADQNTTPGTRPNELPAPCDGYVGQVNGETSCVKSAAARPDSKQSYGTPLLQGNPAASTSADQPAADRQKMPEGGWGPDAGPGGPSGGPADPNFGSPRGAGGLAPSGPGGGASSPGSGAPGTSDPGGSFCQENPTADICKPSNFSGACGGGFTCSGDAVSCAMAREQYNRNCMLYDIDTPLSMKGRDYVGWGSQATPPGHPGAPANIQNTTFSFSSLINMQNEFGNACPSDRTFSGAGSSFVIPFSQMCGPMQLMGQVMVAICLLGSVAIVFRGGK